MLTELAATRRNCYRPAAASRTTRQTRALRKEPTGTANSRRRRPARPVLHSPGTAGAAQPGTSGAARPASPRGAARHARRDSAWRNAAWHARANPAWPAMVARPADRAERVAQHAAGRSGRLGRQRGRAGTAAHLATDQNSRPPNNRAEAAIPPNDRSGTAAHRTTENQPPTGEPRSGRRPGNRETPTHRASKKQPPSGRPRNTHSPDNREPADDRGTENHPPTGQPRNGRPAEGPLRRGLGGGTGPRRRSVAPLSGRCRISRPAHAGRRGVVRLLRPAWRP